MQVLRIIVLAVVAGALYGILHDQITARVCVEYFTIGHPPLFATHSPTLLAIGWGFVATWWVSLPLGIFLAIAARAGRAPKRSARELLRPLAALLCAMGLVALAGGIIGYHRAQAGRIDPWVAKNIEPSKRVAFMADWSAHAASYTAGEIGGFLLSAFVWFSRQRARNDQVVERPR